MKPLYLCLCLVSFLVPAQTGPTYQKVAAYVAQQGGDPEQVTSQVLVVRERGVTTIRDWQVPNIPEPPADYWDTLTDDQARDRIKEKKQKAKPDALKLIENRIMERLWEDGVVSTNVTRVTPAVYEKTVTALVTLASDTNIPPEKIQEKLKSYAALKTGLDLLGGDVMDIRYHEDVTLDKERKKRAKP